MQTLEELDLYHMPMSDPAMGENPWPHFEKAAEWIMEARAMVTDPNALNYGLMPSGFSDGGTTCTDPTEKKCAFCCTRGAPCGTLGRWTTGTR